MSLAAAMLLGTGCGGGGETSTTPTATDTSATFTVERGRVLNATVTDAAGHTGRQTGNGQYTFDQTPTYPVSVTGGVIDVNNNGVVDAGEPFLTIPMETYEGSRVTLVTTLIADADKTVRDEKLTALQTALQTASGQTVTAVSLLQLPTENREAAVLSNELYEAVLTGEIPTINDVNLTEMTTLLNGAQFVVDYDTMLANIESNATLAAATTEELAKILETETLQAIEAVVYVNTPTQEEIDIMNSTYEVTEALVSQKSIGTIILYHMSTPFGSSIFGATLRSDHTVEVNQEGRGTWRVENGNLYITFTGADSFEGIVSGEVKMKFEAAPDVNGNFRALFEYTDADGNVFNESGSFSLYDIPNSAPTAFDQNVTLQQDSAVAITLSGSDVDGDPLTYHFGWHTPLNGTLSGTAPNLTYTPNSGFSGTDMFDFYVSDGTNDSEMVFVGITVSEVFVNTAPTAAAQAVSVQQDGSVAITLSGSDVDGDNLSYSIGTNPVHGTLSGTVPNLTYTPASGYTGSDSFTFKVNDGNADSAPATVSITVKEAFAFGTVTSPFTGRVWMDRNMGASQVCTTHTDTACYGDYYQWGRDADGHEEFNSSISYTVATDIHNAGSAYINSNILATGIDDWTTGDPDGSLRRANWAKTDGSSVCPVGFRVPTMAELQAETVDITDSSNLDANFLKLPSAGSREYGEYRYQGESSTTWVSDGAFPLYVDAMIMDFMPDFGPVRAENIRCIEEIVVP